MSSLYLPAGKANAALFIALVATLTATAIGPAELAPASALLALGLSWASMVDLDRFILPDAVNLLLIFAGLSLACAEGPGNALPFLIGAAAGYLSLAGLAWTYRIVRRRDGLGLGDAKLLAASGAWLGWTALPLVILLASLTCIAAVILQSAARRRVLAGPLAFGPYLAAATWLMWLADIGGRA